MWFSFDLPIEKNLSFIEETTIRLTSIYHYENVSLEELSDPFG